MLGDKNIKIEKNPKFGSATHDPQTDHILQLRGGDAADLDKKEKISNKKCNIKHGLLSSVKKK